MQILRWVKPCHAMFLWENKKYIAISIISQRQVWIEVLVEDRGLSILHSHYHGCWWPGNERCHHIRWLLFCRRHFEMHFYWMKIFLFWFKFHWSWSLRVQLNKVMKFESKYNAFHTRIWVWECRLQNVSHFFRPQCDCWNHICSWNQ